MDWGDTPKQGHQRLGANHQNLRESYRTNSPLQTSEESNHSNTFTLDFEPPGNVAHMSLLFSDSVCGILL